MSQTRTGTGQGGKSFQDRKLAADVRTQALKDVQAILKGNKGVEKWSEYKKQLILRLATTILPRLNEHTGADGKELPVPILTLNVQGDDRNA